MAETDETESARRKFVACAIGATLGLGTIALAVLQLAYGISYLGPIRLSWATWACFSGALGGWSYAERSARAALFDTIILFTWLVFFEWLDIV